MYAAGVYGGITCICGRVERESRGLPPLASLAKTSAVLDSVAACMHACPFLFSSGNGLFYNKNKSQSGSHIDTVGARTRRRRVVIHFFILIVR